VTETVLWMLGGIATLVIYIVFQIVGEAVWIAISFPFKPLFDGPVWREMDGGLKFLLTLVLTVVAIITVIGLLIAFAHYHEFKNG